MEFDERPAKSPDAPVARLLGEDLDPLSADELHARIAALRTEIARVEQRLAALINHRASADALFKR